MNKPSIFLNYYNPNQKLKSFQDLLQEDIAPEILLEIKESIKNELLGNKIQELLPNFDWTSSRMVEKWGQISQSLILQVQLPEQIWNEWIISLGGNGTVKTEEKIIETEDTLPQEVDTFQNILTGNEEENIETEDHVVQENEQEEKIDLEPKDEEKPVKKLFETHQGQEKSLKYLVENKLVENLNSAFSINQKIQFTIGLFDGDNEKFSQFINFLEKELSEENWEEHIINKYPHFLDDSCISTWNELKSILLRKYNS